MSSEYELSNGNPMDSRGYTQVYPDQMERLKGRKQNDEPRDKILSREQSAEYLSVSLSTIDRMIRDKKIPFYRVAGRILLSKKRLNEWRMLKESLPDFNWEEEVVEKQHKLRLIEIHKRTLELCKICEPVYERLIP